MQTYQRKEKLEKENKENQYRSKIDLQESIIEKCISSGLHFSTVIGDAWYFSRDLITFLKRYKMNWVSQCKGNRRIKIEGRWTTLDALFPSCLDSETIRISGNVYIVWEVNGKMREIGTVKGVNTLEKRRTIILKFLRNSLSKK